MIQRSFFYTPRTGPKLLARKASTKVAVFRHNNNSFTCLGGVHVCVGGSDAAPRSLRTEFSALAELAVTLCGGAAFDEQGQITLCIPSEAWPRMWKMFAAVKPDLSLFPPKVVHLLYTPFSPTPTLKGAGIDERGFILPEWTGAPSPELRIEQSGQTFRVRNDNDDDDEQWLFGCTLEGTAEPFDPHLAWEAESKAGAYLRTEEIRRFLVLKKDVVLEDPEASLFKNARPETWEILGPAFENARQNAKRVTVADVMHFDDGRRFSKTLAKFADFDGFRGLTPRPARKWLSQTDVKGVVLKHNGGSEDDFERRWEEARSGQAWPEGLIPKDFLFSFKNETCPAFKAALKELWLLEGDKLPADDDSPR